MKTKKILITILLFQLLIPLRAFSTEIEQTILEHIKYLTDDKLEGRLAGTKGADLAADYIAEKFKEYGLKPIIKNSSYLQQFSFISGAKLASHNEFSITCKNKTVSFALSKDFLPLAFSKSGTASTELIFAGYGISAAEINYDDYKSIDAQNKIILILMHYPRENDENNPFRKLEYHLYSDLQYKISVAQSHGAVGVIIINDMNNHKGMEDELIGLNDVTVLGSAGIPVIQVKRKLLFDFLKDCDVDIEKIEESISKELKPFSQKLPDVKAFISVDLIKKESETKNVIGILKGDEDKYIVIGAHYDHIGKGQIGDRDIKAQGKIHPGADDNASGVSALLELAYRLTKSYKGKGKSIIFIAFSAEEMGIQGSTYFVNKELINLKDIFMMINMDMVGRLRNNTLIIGGMETAEEFKSIISSIKTILNFKFSPDGYGPSDHSAFYNKKIPVLFLFTGAHLDHHKPSDTLDKINIEGIKLIVDFLEKLVSELNKPEIKLTFHKTKSQRPLDTVAKGYGAYLGTIPDFTYSNDGVKVNGVKEGSPAEKSGLHEGDILIQIADKKIHNLYDLTYALREHKPGDKVKIKILRKGEEKILTAVLGKRP